MDITLSVDEVVRLGLQTAYTLAIIKTKDGVTYEEIEELSGGMSKSQVRRSVKELEHLGVVLVETGLIGANVALILYIGDEPVPEVAPESPPKEKPDTSPAPKKSKPVKKKKRASKKKKPETPSMFPEPKHKVQQWIDENLENVAKLEKQMKPKECDALLEEYGKEALRDVLLAMENKKTLVKDYNSVYLTALNWLKRRGNNATTTHRSGFKSSNKKTRGDTQAEQISRYA